jgi:hypothetical protein
MTRTSTHRMFADDMAETTVAWSDQWYDRRRLALEPTGFVRWCTRRESVRVPQSAYAPVRPRCAGDRERRDRDQALLAFGTTTSARCGTARRLLRRMATTRRRCRMGPTTRMGKFWATWLVICAVRGASLPSTTVEGIDRSLRLCVEGELPDRSWPGLEHRPDEGRARGGAGHRHEPSC